MSPISISSEVCTDSLINFIQSLFLVISGEDEDEDDVFIITGI
jgi:hypothetical protein